MTAEVALLPASTRGDIEPIDKLVGDSPPMQELRELVRQVARSARPVLVTGPTGSGKELAVGAIHGLGSAPDAPLLDLNCSALPASLIESQLFGHERGAFTGADMARDGYFASVGEGTLFLDEIGELPLDLQAKLLRVLESYRFRPVGAQAAKEFRGRIVCATHVDLAQRVADGTFREDLYYRLNVLEIRMPALEERRADIPALLAHFVAQQDRPLAFAPDAIEALQEAAWPGNVRQLRNAVDRLAVFAPAGPIARETVARILGWPARQNPCTVRQLAREVLRAVRDEDVDKLKLLEGTLVEEALHLAQGNKTAAARLLGVHRKVIERRVA